MIKFGNDIIKVNNSWLNPGEPTPPGPDPYNPLNLPPFTIRLLYEDGVIPSYYGPATYIQVSSSPNIWDYTYNSPYWSNILSDANTEIEILGANTSGVTDMSRLFNYHSNLTKVALFDTRDVTDTRQMFHMCESLKSIPLYDVSNVLKADEMFYKCVNVESGALDMYNELVHNAYFHTDTFKDCGINTITGAAELAQIPSDWK